VVTSTAGRLVRPTVQYAGYLLQQSAGRVRYARHGSVIDRFHHEPPLRVVWQGCMSVAQSEASEVAV
jgi:hypothetical protein